MSLLPWRFTPIGIAHLTIMSRSGMRVMTGPFQGMRCVSEAQGSCLPPKLIGCYERELHGVFEAYRKQPVEVVIDIGAAEGYYAVGVLHAGIARRSIAYEAAEEGGKLLREMTRLNGMEDRLTVKGFCRPEDLQAELAAAAGVSTLLIVDVEGAEELLLDPERVPGVRKVDILVELHDTVVPGITDRIRNWFSESHTITRFDQVDRTLDENLCQGGLARFIPSRYRLDILNEKRFGHMHWFWMRPLSKT